MRSDVHQFRALEEPAPGGFTVLELVPEPVRQCSRGDALGGHRLYRGRDGFVAGIPETVVAELLAFARRAAPKEWIGLVVVELCDDRDGRFVLVHGVVPDTGAVAELASVRTTTESEFRTRRLAEVLFPAAIPGGWAHSHPRYGVFFSGMDRETQRTWTESHALGIVVDPWDPRELVIFRGPEAERLEYVGRAGGIEAPSVAKAGAASRPATPATPDSKQSAAREVVAAKRAGARPAEGVTLRAARLSPARAKPRASALALVCAVVAGCVALLAHTNRRIDDVDVAIARLEALARARRAPAATPPGAEEQGAADALACNEEVVASIGPTPATPLVARPPIESRDVE